MYRLIIAQPPFPDNAQIHVFLSMRAKIAAKLPNLVLMRYTGAAGRIRPQTDAEAAFRITAIK